MKVTVKGGVWRNAEVRLVQWDSRRETASIVTIAMLPPAHEFIAETAGRNPQGSCYEVWPESVGAYIISLEQEVRKAVQSPMVRVVGSQHQENRMDSRGGREASASGKGYANAVANNRPARWTHSSAMPRAIRASPVRHLIQPASCDRSR